jgi:hypothetical protein
MQKMAEERPNAGLKTSFRKPLLERWKVTCNCDSICPEWIK